MSPMPDDGGVLDFEPDLSEYIDSSLFESHCRKNGGIKPNKAPCPFCKNPKTHKRKNAYGWYCRVCKIAFRGALVTETHDAEEI
jgi:hypothetical protein